MNSFLGTEKSEAGGVQGANRLTGDFFFDGKLDSRVKVSQRKKKKNIKMSAAGDMLLFPPVFPVDSSDGK